MKFAVKNSFLHFDDKSSSSDLVNSRSSLSQPQAVSRQTSASRDAPQPAARLRSGKRVPRRPRALSVPPDIDGVANGPPVEPRFFAFFRQNDRAHHDANRFSPSIGQRQRSPGDNSDVVVPEIGGSASQGGHEVNMRSSRSEHLRRVLAGLQWQAGTVPGDQVGTRPAEASHDRSLDASISVFSSSESSGGHSSESDVAQIIVGCPNTSMDDKLTESADGPCSLTDLAGVSAGQLGEAIRGSVTTASFRDMVLLNTRGLSSLGSLRHADPFTRCEPCRYNYPTLQKPCWKGFLCERCHIDAPHARSRMNRKLKRNQRKQVAQNDLDMDGTVFSI